VPFTQDGTRTGSGPEGNTRRTSCPRTPEGDREAAQDEVRDEEVRLAVVLNGGASLAVWMGGVTTEIHELTSGGQPLSCLPDARSGGEVYDEVLRLLGATARVDVIAGTSAGGINGAFLALGQVRPQADLSALERLWAERGSLEALLRNPVRGRHHSLFRGDDYFLPELQAAFEQLVGTRQPRTSPGGRPVDLFLTCTLLNGQHHSFVDSVGQGLWEVEHTGLLTFSRTPEDLDPRHEAPNRTRSTSEEGVPNSDDFSGDIAHRLALATRATASFPAAFEPVFLPVLPGDTVGPAGEGSPRRWKEVNLRDHASFGASRYAIDGGVLCNQPIAPALRAIARKRAELPVRRMLLYVNPDPSGQTTIVPDEVEDAPRLREVLMASLTRLTIGQNVYEELSRIERANLAAEASRGAWPHLVAALPDELAPERFAEAFGRYRDLRTRAEGLQTGRTVGELWLRDRVKSLAGDPSPELIAHRQRVQTVITNHVARRADPEGTSTADPLRWLFEPRGGDDGTQWQWGREPAERFAAFALEQITRAQRLPCLRRRKRDVPELQAYTDPYAALRADLRTAKREVHAVLSRLRSQHRAEHHYWSRWTLAHRDQLYEVATDGPRAGELAPALDTAYDGLGPWIEKEASHRGLLRPADAVRGTLACLGTVAGVVNAPAVGDCRERDDLVGTLRSLGLLDREGKVPPECPERAEAVLRRLFLAEIYVVLAGVEEPLQGTYPVELVLLSSHTNPLWARCSTNPKNKIAGMKLAHFGAFYKRSWRINDWIWGRVDASTRLMESLLDPRRLLEREVAAEDLLEALRSVGWDARELERNCALAEELDGYRNVVPGKEPDRLPVTAGLFATARHWRIVTDEALHDLQRAAQFDVARGAHPYGAQDRPDRPHAGLRPRRSGRSPQTGSAPSRRVERVERERRLQEFDEAGVGAQSLQSESGTDLFSRTVAVSVANITAMASSGSCGLGPLGVAARTLHGVALLLYSLVVSGAKGRVGACLVNLALAAGGALVAVGVLGGVGRHSGLLMVGGAMSLAGICAAALRSRILILAMVGVPLFLFLLLLLLLDTSRSEGLASTAVVVLGIVAAAWSLGLLREPDRTPSWGHAVKVLRIGSSMVLLGLVGTALWGGCRWTASWAGTDPGVHDPVLRRWLREELPWTAWAVACLASLLLPAMLSGLYGLITQPAAGEISPQARERNHLVRWLPWYGTIFAVICLAGLGYLSALPPGRVTPVWVVSVGLSSALSWAFLALVIPLGMAVRRPGTVRSHHPVPDRTP
jgi:patatin-related protein